MSRHKAAVRAAAHVPKRLVTTLAGGHAPTARRSSTSPPRRRAWVRDQSYDDGRRPATSAPRPHRGDYPLASPAPLDRAGMAGLAIRVGVPLPVARLRVSATAAADADVARLDRPRLLAGRVIEVGLDRRLRASQPVGDLRDCQALLLAIVPSKGRGAPTLTNSVAHLTPPRAAGSTVAPGGRWDSGELCRTCWTATDGAKIEPPG